MFPSVGSQTFIEPGSPEDFHMMEVKNVSRDSASVTSFSGIARSVRRCHTSTSANSPREGDGLVFADMTSSWWALTNPNTSSTSSSTKPGWPGWPCLMAGHFDANPLGVGPALWREDVDLGSLCLASPERLASFVAKQASRIQFSHWRSSGPAARMTPKRPLPAKSGALGPALKKS